MRKQARCSLSCLAGHMCRVYSTIKDQALGHFGDKKHATIISSLAPKPIHCFFETLCKILAWSFAMYHAGGKFAVALQRGVSFIGKQALGPALVYPG